MNDSLVPKSSHTYALEIRLRGAYTLVMNSKATRKRRDMSKKHRVVYDGRREA